MISDDDFVDLKATQKAEIGFLESALGNRGHVDSAMNLRPASWSVSEESEIEELELIIHRFLALIGNISLNHVPITAFTDRCDKISFCP